MGQQDVSSGRLYFRALENDLSHQDTPHAPPGDTYSIARDSPEKHKNVRECFKKKLNYNYHLTFRENLKSDASVYVSGMVAWSRDVSSGHQLTNQNDHASMVAH